MNLKYQSRAIGALTWQLALAACSAVCASVTSSSVQAQETLAVATLTNTTLQQAVYDSVTNTLAKQVAKEKANGNEHPDAERVDWDISASERVELSRVDGNTVGVRANLVYNHPSLPSPDLDLVFKLKFFCRFQDPGLSVYLSDFETEVDYSWVVDVLTGGISELLTSTVETIVNNQDDIQQGVQGAAQSNIDFGENLFCPRFDVSSDGNVIMSWVEGNECTSGQKKHRECPQSQMGSGITDYCIHGIWEQERDCEPGRRGGQLP